MKNYKNKTLMNICFYSKADLFEIGGGLSPVSRDEDVQTLIPDLFMNFFIDDKNKMNSIYGLIKKLNYDWINYYQKRNMVAIVLSYKKENKADFDKAGNDILKIIKPDIEENEFYSMDNIAKIIIEFAKEG